MPPRGVPGFDPPPPETMDVLAQALGRSRREDPGQGRRPQPPDRNLEHPGARPDHAALDAEGRRQPEAQPHRPLLHRRDRLALRRGRPRRGEAQPRGAADAHGRPRRGLELHRHRHGRGRTGERRAAGLRVRPSARPARGAGRARSSSRTASCAGADAILRDQFARTPYAVSFRAGDQGFTLVSIHVHLGQGTRPTGRPSCAGSPSGSPRRRATRTTSTAT